MKRSKEWIIVGALVLTASGCATLQQKGILKPDDIGAVCKDIRMTCDLTRDVDLRARIACERMVPVCDQVAPTTTTSTSTSSTTSTTIEPLL